MVVIALLAMTTDVLFATAMPSDQYRVLYELQSNLGATIYTTNKTATGFTLNVSTSVAGTVGYVAVAD